MFGPSKKNEMRKRAMDSIMKEGPSLAISIMKKSPMEESGEEIEQMGEKEGGEQQGLESFMVSPEEKQMVLEMRKKHKVGMSEE